MNIGQFNLNQKSAYDHRRTGDREEGGSRFYQDIPRLILLIAMLVFAIGGYWINRYYNQPERVVARSVAKGLEQGFRASIEGNESLPGVSSRELRAREVYSPETGIRPESGDTNSYNADRLPYDALTALQSLSDVPWTEQQREDMYGLGTRHFTGILTTTTSEENVARVYEYWIDLKTRLPVRMTLSEVIRDPESEDEENPLSTRIYLNIRYFGWQ